MVYCCCIQWEKMTLQKSWFFFFWFAVSSWGTHLSSFFTFPICFKCWVTTEWYTVEFFSNFLCSCKRISFDNCSQLVVVNFQWLVSKLLIFKALISFVKLLKPPLHCMFISSSWAKCVLELSPLLYDTFWTQIRKPLEFAFLSNIISIVWNKYKIVMSLAKNIYKARNAH